MLNINISEIIFKILNKALNKNAYLAETISDPTRLINLQILTSVIVTNNFTNVVTVSINFNVVILDL
jgi:hypothetical protein